MDYSKFFTEIRDHSISESRSNASEISKKYLDIIYNKMMREEVYMDSDVSKIVIPIGKCETEMCSGLIDQIIDKEIVKIMGPGFKLNRIVHENIDRQSFKRVLGLFGVPINLKKEYTFDYEIKWNLEE